MDDPTIYCEWLGGHDHQPLNTLSSLAFIVAAYLVYRHLNSFKETDWRIKLMPFSIALIGLGSAAWHYFNNDFGDIFDTISIGLFAILIATYILSKLTNNSNQRLLLLVVLIPTTIAVEQLDYLNGSLVYIYMFGLLGVSLYMLHAKAKSKSREAIVAVGLLSLGLIFRTFDIDLCDSFDPGTHFIWHLSTAAATYYLVKSLTTITS